MKTPQKLMRCLYLQNSVKLILLAICIFSCEKNIKYENRKKEYCISLPQIIKLEGKSDTLKVGDKYYGNVVFSEKLDSRITARIYVLGHEIYFNRDTTQFGFLPRLTSDTSEVKEIDGKVELKYSDCLDTVIYLKTKYVLLE